jgi:hypothetical protein
MEASYELTKGVTHQHDLFRRCDCSVAAAIEFAHLAITPSSKTSSQTLSIENLATKFR